MCIMPGVVHQSCVRVCFEEQRTGMEMFELCIVMSTHISICICCIKYMYMYMYF